VFIGAGIVLSVQSLRRWLPRPGIRTRAITGVLTVLALVPALLRLPRVSVVACFDSAHPLYQWVPSTEFSAGVHCVSAPASVVSWTLMVGATLIVQLVLLPLMLVLGTVLMRAARRLSAIAHQALAAALVQLSALLVPGRRPIPVPIRVQSTGALRTRENPRRGPPTCR